LKKLLKINRVRYTLVLFKINEKHEAGVILYLLIKKGIMDKDFYNLKKGGVNLSRPMVLYQMRNDAKQLTTTLTHSWSELCGKKDLIIETVNTRMSMLPDIHRLIGYNPLQMMYDNHRYHFKLIIQIMKLQDFDMLINVIPWVYRTYHIHGFHYDYFPIAFHQWIKAI